MAVQHQLFVDEEKKVAKGRGEAQEAKAEVVRVRAEKLTKLRDPARDVYGQLERMAQRLEEGQRKVFGDHGVVATISRIGSAHCVYFADHAPVDWWDRIEPMLPTDAHEPTLPIDSTDPVEAIDSTELRDQRDLRPLTRRSVALL